MAMDQNWVPQSQDDAKTRKLWHPRSQILTPGSLNWPGVHHMFATGNKTTGCFKVLDSRSVDLETAPLHGVAASVAGSGSGGTNRWFSMDFNRKNAGKKWEKCWEKWVSRSEKLGFLWIFTGRMVGEINFHGGWMVATIMSHFAHRKIMCGVPLTWNTRNHCLVWDLHIWNHKYFGCWIFGGMGSWWLLSSVSWLILIGRNWGISS